ncbi:glycerol-3-phosphate responsive antiterminator [Desulfocurvus sp. DL9XJH121]
MHPLFATTRTNPVIAAVRDSSHLDAALDSEIRVIFMMGGTLSEARDLTKRTHERGKHILFHVELVKGLGRDHEGIAYMAETVRPDGMISTKPYLLHTAKSLGLLCVLQIFMIDTQAYVTGLKNIRTTLPDAVEIMPGLMPGVVDKLSAEFDLPFFTAGLVKLPEEVELMLQAGVAGVAVSEQSLWSWRP